MYIGNDLQIAHPSYKIIDDISSGFNGSTTSFALQVSGATPVPFPISTQQVMISVNGVVQEPDPTGSAGFKLLGSNIVFSSAPANGHAFFGVINAGADYVTAGSEFPDGSATAPSFTFQDDQDTGWYRNASGEVGYSSNGSAILNFDGNGLTIAAGKGLTVDTNTLKVDAANNRIGIGLTNPQRTVHLSSNNTVLALTDTAASTDQKTKYILSDAGIFAVGKLNDAYDTAVEHFRIDNDSNATFAGQIKIGTVARIESTGEYKAPHGSAATPSFNFLNDNDNGMYRITTNTLGFSTAGTERMRIDSAGKVGIGVTPLKALHVKSTGAVLRLETTATTGSNYIDFNDADENKAFIGLGSGGDDSLSIWNVKNDTVRIATNNTERMRIDSSGKVGIGTTSPESSTKLQIKIPQSGTAAGTGMTISGWNGSAESRVQFMSYGIGDGTLAIRIGTSNTERLRVASAGQIGISGANYGTSGQVLTSGGASAAPSWTTISSAPTVDLVADGAISANEAVIVKATGKASAITGFSFGESSVSEWVDNMATAHDDRTTYAFDTANNQIVIFYRDDKSSSPTYRAFCRVGTINSANTSITWNTAVQVSHINDTLQGGNITCLSSGVYVCAYNVSNGEYTRVITVSGSGSSATVALGTVLDISESGNNNMYNINLEHLRGTSNKVVLVWHNNYNGRGDLRVLTVSNTGTNATISSSSRQAWFGNRPTSIKTDWDTSANRLVCFYRYNNAPYSTVISFSGDSASAGSAISFGTTAEDAAGCYDAKNNRYWGLYKNTDNNVYYRWGTLHSNQSQITWSGAHTALGGNANSNYRGESGKIFADATSGNISIYWVASNTFYMRYGTYDTSVSGDLSLSSEVTMSSDIYQSSYAPTYIQKLNNNATGFLYRSHSDTGGKFRIRQFASTDMTTENFIGFSSAGYSDGNTATINVVGNTTTQSSLTPGQKYYVQNDGSIGLTAGSVNVVAGKALTSTKLLIQPA